MESNIMERRFLRVPEAMQRYGIGRNKAYSLARETQAVIKNKGITLIDTAKIDKFLENGGLRNE